MGDKFSSKHNILTHFTRLIIINIGLNKMTLLQFVADLLSFSEHRNINYLSKFRSQLR